MTPPTTTPLKIEAGKFYRLRNGLNYKCLSIEPKSKGFDFPVQGVTSQGEILTHAIDGRFRLDREYPVDIIAEWIDEPQETTPLRPYVAWNPANAPKPPEGYRFIMECEADNDGHYNSAFWEKDDQKWYIEDGFWNWNKEDVVATLDPLPPGYVMLPDGLPGLPACPEEYELTVHGWEYDSEGRRGIFFCSSLGGNPHWSSLYDCCGHECCYYLEAVPISREEDNRKPIINGEWFEEKEPNYLDWAYQKSVLDAAWDGVPCQYFSSTLKRWNTCGNFAEMAVKIRTGHKVRIRPKPPEPEWVPLDAEHIPIGSCLVDGKTWRLVTEVTDKGIYAGNLYRTYAELFSENLWIKYPEVTDLQPCRKRRVG